eukprot:GFUD01044598.1.p1 GENE.GFUD01044598.1~~GFUD01044598.1.p1  ORF type:complete len:860 (+),score=160.26 GFUD01044598.1:257-2836(+)
MECPPSMVIKRKDQEVRLFFQELGQIFRSEHFCDVKIKCCDGEVACQSVLLSAASPFLRHIFSTRSISEDENQVLLIVPNTKCLEVEIFLSGLLGLNGKSDIDLCDSPEFKKVWETFEAFTPLKPQYEEALVVTKEKLVTKAVGVFPAENWCQISIKSENGDHETNVDTKDIYKLSDANYDDASSDEDDSGDDDDDSNDADFKLEKTILPKRESADTNEPPKDNFIGINKRKPGRPKKGEMREKTVDDEAYIEIIPGADGKNNFKCKECGAQFERKWSMTMHIRIHTKERPYVCEYPDCGSSFARPQNLWRHNKTHTQEKPHLCPICGKGFCERKDMLTHIIIHDESRKTQNRFLPAEMMDMLLTEQSFEFDGREVRTDSICDICGKIFELPTMKRRHVNQVHEGMKPYQCVQSDCGRSFTSKSGLDRHITDHTGEFPFLCPECPKKFKSSTELKQHSVRHMDPDDIGSNRKCPHEGCAKIFEKKFYLDIHVRRHHTHEKPFECAECGKSFTVKAALKDHERVHTGEKPYDCDICNKAFSTSGALRIHKMIHDEQRRYTCDVEECGKMFRINKNLWRHKKVDHGILAEKGDGKIVECPDCGKRCSDKHALEKHQIKHTVEKNYVCTICGKRLKRQNSLDLHMRQHSGVKNYMCDQCDSTYFTASALRNHKVNKHMEVKETFLCTFCGKGFTKKANLDSHITLHTGEKRYNCPHCEKKFRSHSVFQNHLRYHKGKKEFVCQYCGKAFMQKSHLQRHTATHTGERKHVCPVCSKSFIEPGDVRKHMRTHSKESVNYHTGGDMGGGTLHDHDLNQDIPDIKPPGLAWVETHHLAQSPPHMLAPTQALAAAAMLEHAHRTFQI